MLVLQTSFVRAQVSSELEPVSLAVVDFRGVLAKSEAARNIRSAVDENAKSFGNIFLRLRTACATSRKICRKNDQ